MKTKVLIIVRGGLVQSVESTEPIEYCVVDWDNIESIDTEDVDFFSDSSFTREDETISEQQIENYFVEANEAIQENIDFMC